MILKCNRTLKAVLFTSLFIGHSLADASTIEIPKSSVSAPSSLGEIKLFHDEQGFHVVQEDKTTLVDNCWVDPVLQDVSNEDVEEYLTSGRIFVSQMDNGEFSLRTKLCLKGSGLICGWIGYWATKVGLYVGVPTVIVGTSGAALAPTVAAGAGAAGAGAAAAGTAVVATTATTAGAATGVAATATAVGPVAAASTGIIASVEAAATAVGAFFTSLWFLP